MIEKYLNVVEKKINNKLLVTLLRSFIAGAFIACAGIGSIFGNFYTKNNLIGALIFPIGLIMIILTSSELFTGNCLFVIPLLNKKINLKQLFCNWGIVYLGNFIGALFITLLAVFSGSLNNVANSIINIMHSKISFTFFQLLLKGILCNFLVCTAILISSITNNIIEKIFAVFFPIMLFVLSGFEHSIANMFYLPAGLFLQNIKNINSVTIIDIIVNNLIPVTIGNIVGGALLGIIFNFSHPIIINNNKKLSKKILLENRENLS